MNERLRALIVDDEPLARERIRRLLDREPEVEIISLCGNGALAVECILRDRPNLVFLDVQMPGIDGLRVVEEIGASHMPVTVFVTAFDHYAIQAFEAHALDYLLKPFNDERFRQSLERARKAVQEQHFGALGRQLTGILETAKRGSTGDLDPMRASDAMPLERIVIRSGDRAQLLSVGMIDWIEAAGPYAELRAQGDSHLLRMPMHELEARLDHRRFARIHRSTIVNLDRVKELQEYFRGEYIVLLHDGTKLKLSRGRRAQLEALLGQSL